MHQSDNDPAVTDSHLIMQIDKLVEAIHAAQQQQKGKDQKCRLMVGVCGVPGSGKSTISQALATRFKHAIVLPMDGFHLYRNQLNEDGLKRRGAAFTFDLQKFEATTKKVKQAEMGSTLLYPSFDHEHKDPVEESICITGDTQIVIVQGIYVFDKHLSINSPDKQFWDIRIWVKADLNTCMQRVAKRHVASGIEPTYELAVHRANANDRLNAQYIMDNCYEPGQYLSALQWKAGMKNYCLVIENNQTTFYAHK